MASPAVVGDRWGEKAWGTFKWGNTSRGRPFTWMIDVDWDGDGLFNGTNEAIAPDINTGAVKGRLLSLDVTRGRQFFLKSDGSGFEDVVPGSVQIELLDLDGRYNPYNTTGPLFSYLQKNQKIMVRLQYLNIEGNDPATTYWTFVGYIDDIRPNFGKYVSTATIYASDGRKKLDVPVNNQNIYQTIRYNTAISQVLNDVRWPDAVSIDATASDTMPYWWESGRSAWTEIMDLVDANFGAFCIDADGTAHYLSNVANDIAVMTLTESDIDLAYGIRVPSPRETIRNVVRIYARSRAQQALGALWQAVDKPSIPAGGSLEVWANFAYNNIACPALTVTAPVATTDYTANTQADGLGTDKTANVSLAFYPFGTSAKLVFTNNDAGGVYMTLMKVRGVALTADPYTYSEKQDAASIADYTRRDLVIQTDWLQDLNSAIDKASTLKAKLAHPRQFPRVKIKRNSYYLCFGADLFDLVSINFPSKQITGELRVGYLHHSWNIQEANVIDTEIYFEPNLFANASGTWIFPAIIGTTTKFA